jgi:hypothetical protein
MYVRRLFPEVFRKLSGSFPRSRIFRKCSGSFPEAFPEAAFSGTRSLSSKTSDFFSNSDASDFCVGSFRCESNSPKKSMEFPWDFQTVIGYYCNTLLYLCPPNFGKSMENPWKFHGNFHGNSRHLLCRNPQYVAMLLRCSVQLCMCVPMLLFQMTTSNHAGYRLKPMHVTMLINGARLE